MKSAAALLLLALFAVTAARADEPDPTPTPRELLERGLRSYAVGAYADAIEAFRAGYRREPLPDFLYALAQALRMSGDCAGALAAYRAFLRTNPPERSAAGARQNIERCRAQLESARPPPSVIAPPANAIVPAISIEAPPLPRKPWHRDAAGAVLGALGLAALGAGGALWGVGESGVDAANAATRYDQFLAGPGAERERAAGIAGVALGGALLVAAVVRYAWAARHRR